ncbi:hypothetical protein FS749_004116 [Ceratobasidium sp. UAMH 11750]|nr:hypothetical protein FS749_004116 [Ceratobasidium sp. UAMH 11750]
MLDKDSFIEILDRLQSPTYGAPPSDLQLAALQESQPLSDQSQVSFDTLKPGHVATLQDTILQLDRDAAALSALHTTLQNRMNNAITYYQRATAALAPINRFPAEVLAQIFVAGKHLELNFCARMSWVARRWRDIALRTPELWNRIPLTSFFRVLIYLGRTGSTPLDIEVDARTYRVKTFALRQSMDLLGQQLHRWRHIKVLLEDHDQAQLILRPLEDLCRRISEGSSTCQLSSIRFGVPYSPNVISGTYKSFLRIPPTATLRAIELLEVDLACVPATPPASFHNMQKLSLSSLENMQLETHLFGALAGMPNLTSLVLDQCIFIVPQLGEDSLPTITLAKLAVFELSHIPDETANIIFSKLYAPNLQVFGWYSRRLEMPSAILDWEALRARYLTLSVLKLRNITSYATKYLLRWLKELPNLTSLTVIFGELSSPKNVRRSAEEILGLLSQVKAPCCVRLRRLKIGDLDENGLVKLQATIQAKPSLKMGRVAAILQPGTQNSKKREQVMAWLGTHHSNYKVYEVLQDGVDQEDLGEEESDDDSDEE